MGRDALLAGFRAVARAHAARPAIADGALRLDYAGLARRSAALARTIDKTLAAGAATGAPPAAAQDAAEGGRRVALLCSHRAPAIVGLLAALEAGACVVPLDIAESDERLAALWRAAGEPVVLAEARQIARARRLLGPGARIVELEADATLEVDPVASSTCNDVGDGVGATLNAGGAADPLVAILFTSGTTAAPKGVMTTGESVFERARQYALASGIAPGERQAVITAWHFAASIPEVQGALLAGAELCLYDARARGVDGLAEWLSAERIALLQLPVAIARRLLGALAPGALAGVRFASISGDRLTPGEAEALLATMAPGATLLHTYGSTETNLIAQCALRLPARDWPAASDAGFLPVGAPVAGKRIHVLDEEGGPVAPGARGRIAVESARLSPGYWRDPARTAESFVAAPGGGRMFVTSDFGRLRADGALELAGRDAAQVKIRGMRVDLAAVEALLLGLGGVAGAAVDVRPDPRGEPRLVAWIEAVRGTVLETSGLRAGLAGRLPAHAIPARFVFVDALPWTANGKLDRRGLPDPGRTRPALTAPFVAPRDADEAFVCTALAARFDLEAVGADDGFFDLGGDSLQLVELMAALEREAGAAIPLAALGAVPTPARLAAALRTARASREERDPVIASPTAPLVAPPVAERKGGAIRVLRRTLKQAVKHPLRAGGPVVAGRALPLEAGQRLHGALARALAPTPLFREPLAAIDAWHARLGLATPLADARRRSLRANTWVGWRLQALASDAAFARGVRIEGAENLDAVADHGCGIVLVVTHVHWNALLRRLPALAKREVFLIRQGKGLPFGAGADAIVTERAEQLQAAARILAQGGAVLIAGDEGHGQAAVERDFFGAPRRFRPGAAALAESTRAALLPVFSWLADDGRVVFRFESAIEAEIDAGAATPEARIVARTARYADLYVAQWPAIFDSVSWKSVRRALEPPDHW